MIVIADTSPLSYLIQINCDFLLPSLYRRVLVPRGVIEELSHSSAPREVREWLERLPHWLDVHAAAIVPIAELASLDLGEREAIQIAEEVRADLILLDERRGRAVAQLRGLRVTGTLGVLLSGAELRLTDARLQYRRLIDETTFRTSPGLEAAFMQFASKTTT